MTTSVQPAKEKLPVSAILFGILAGIIGVAAGLFLGFALGAALAAAFHVSTFEGEAGYFAAAIALIVTCIVAPGLIVLTLYWQGHKRTLAFRRVDHGLFIAWCYCGVRFWNLVWRSTARPKHQWLDAAARI